MKVGDRGFKLCNVTAGSTASSTDAICDDDEEYKYSHASSQCEDDPRYRCSASSTQAAGSASASSIMACLSLSIQRRTVLTVETCSVWILHNRRSSPVELAPSSRTDQVSWLIARCPANAPIKLKICALKKEKNEDHPLQSGTFAQPGHTSHSVRRPSEFLEVVMIIPTLGNR